MILFFDGISDGIQCTNVSYWVKDYESAFEILTQFVADGWLLQKAIVIDGSDHLVVPIEAFDGQPIQVHIHALQQQWQHLLFCQPIRSFNKAWVLTWHTQLDVCYYDLLASLVKMIVLLEVAHSEASASENTLLISSYKCLLEATRQLYKQTLADRKTNKRQLSKLNANSNEA